MAHVEVSAPNWQYFGTITAVRSNPHVRLTIPCFFKKAKRWLKNKNKTVFEYNYKPHHPGAAN